MDRGRYAGPVGWIDADGDGEWGIALRSAEHRRPTRVRLFAGCGIVADSDPEAELAETEAKFVPMRDARPGLTARDPRPASRPATQRVRRYSVPLPGAVVQAVVHRGASQDARQLRQHRVVLGVHDVRDRRQPGLADQLSASRSSCEQTRSSRPDRAGSSGRRPPAAARSPWSSGGRRSPRAVTRGVALDEVDHDGRCSS